MIFKNSRLMVVFIDPYNFGTVKLKSMINLFNRHYCEIIFNFFKSDITRNINNEYQQEKQKRIINSLDGVEGITEKSNAEEILECIIQSIKVKKPHNKEIFCFCFDIYTKTNLPLYTLAFFTTHIRGLQKIKEATRRVFKFEGKYRSEAKREYIDGEQLAFDLGEVQTLSEQMFISDLKIKTITHFGDWTVPIPFAEIEKYLLQTTIAQTSDINKYLIKPGIIRDQGNKTYVVKGGKNDASRKDY